MTSRRERSFHDPDAMKLIAQVVGIGVLGPGDLLHRARVEAIVVVRNIHFPLAEKSEDVAVESAEKHVILIQVFVTGGVGIRRVVGQRRSLSYPVLAREDSPRIELISFGIDRLPGEIALPGFRCRPILEMQRLEVIAAKGFRRRAGIVIRKICDLAISAGQFQRAVGRNHVGADMQFPRGSPICQQMIPHRFEAVFRQRERNAARSPCDPVSDPCGSRVRACRIGKNIVVNPLRRRRAAMRRIHIHPVIGKLAEQRLRSFRKPVTVIFEIRGGDREQRLVRRKRIGTRRTLNVTRCRRDISAGPGRDCSFRIAGTLRACGSEPAAQLLRLIGGDGALRGDRAEQRRQHRQPRNDSARPHRLASAHEAPS